MAGVAVGGGERSEGIRIEVEGDVGLSTALLRRACA